MPRAAWLLAVSCMLALALPVRADGPSITMGASSNRVSVGEPFAVEVRVTSNGDDPDKIELPDLSEFELLGRTTSRPMSFSFGFGGGQRAQVHSETVYGFTLRSDSAGAHVIRPAIMSVKGRRIATQSVTIVVVDPAGSAGPQGVADALKNMNDVNALMRRDANQPPPMNGQLDGAAFDNTMFVRTAVDKKRAYLGEQVTVTLYLYFRGQVGDGPQFSREPTLDGFWAQDLLPIQRSMGSVRQDVNGRTFNVYVLRKFAAFPLRTGTLEIGAPALEMGGGSSIFDLLNGPARSLKRDGVKVNVESVPLPAQPTPGAPTHTGALTLTATLEPARAKVGEAVTLRVVARGDGNLRSLSLPNPTMRGVETLPPEIDDKINAPLDRVGGERTFRWLLIPRQPGTQTVPSITVDAFDPASGNFQVVRSAALTLEVTGDASAAPPPENARENDVLQPQFGPLHPESALLRKVVPLASRPFFWPSVLAAPVVLLLFMLGRGVRTRVLARRAAGRDTPGQREVDMKLEQAKQAGGRGDARTALGLLASALKRALELKLAEPVGGMTSRALEGLLESRGMEPDLRTRVLAQLQALEAARFDPAGQSAVQLSQAQSAVHDATKQIARSKLRGAA